jgi:hypothetical protein
MAAKTGADEQQKKLDALAAARAARDEIGLQVKNDLINDGHGRHSLPGQPGNRYDLINSPLCFQSCGLKQKHAQLLPVGDNRSLYGDVLANLQVEMATQQELQKVCTAEQQERRRSWQWKRWLSGAAQVRMWHRTS